MASEKVNELLREGAQCRRIGDFGSARAAFQEAVRLCAEAGDAQTLASGLLALASLALDDPTATVSQHIHGLALVDDAIAVERATSASETTFLGDALLLRASLLSRGGGHPVEALETARDARQLLERLDASNWKMEEALSLVSSMARQAGRPAEALEAAEALVRVCTELGDDQRGCYANVVAATAALECGEPRAVEDYVAEARRLAEPRFRSGLGVRLREELDRLEAEARKLRSSQPR
ncbi:MAG: hypothetical protein JNL38_26750 [Myxococcales bacterium]|nr:hypothetical protein [Myxococcales bacterium]